MSANHIFTCVAQKGIANVRAKKLNGFSLMEMMIVLLIVAIVAAASAPLVSKKMSRSAGTNDSPWVFTGMSGSIAYNMKGHDNDTVIIGASKLPASLNGHTRLFIDSDDNGSHITFGNGELKPLQLTGDPEGRVGFSDVQIPTNSVAFGTDQSHNNNSMQYVPREMVSIGIGTYTHSCGTALGYKANAQGPNSVAIGHGSTAGQLPGQADVQGGVAVGYGATGDGSGAVAVGYCTNANVWRSTALGFETEASSSSSIAIGDRARATKVCAIAIGSEAIADDSYSVAIGKDAVTTAQHQIVLGTANDTVYIPGNLVVEGNSAIGIKGNSKVYLNVSGSSGGGGLCTLRDKMRPNSPNLIGSNDKKTNSGFGATYSEATSWFSDRRLKNVGEKYTAGLTELKKLDFFHYTFKKDEEKTPHVGVIAQDLQKVFPDAVTKGEDGYLRIRFEDMFYAVINAVKELDNKISEIVQNIADINSTIEKQNKTIEEQQNTINELLKRVEKLEKAG